MFSNSSVFLIGPMGAGKSTIGRMLARELQLKFYDSDQVIEERAGAELSWIFDIEGEEGFAKREEKVIDELTEKRNIVLATGGGVVDSKKNRVALAGRGTVIYLKITLEHQYERTKKDVRRPELQTGNVTEKIQTLWKRREPYYEELADYMFLTDELTVKGVAQKILRKLTEPHFHHE